MDRLSGGYGHSHQGMTGFMKGDPQFFLGIQGPVFLFRPGNDPVDRRLKIFHLHPVTVVPDRLDGSLIADVFQVSPDKARGTLGNDQQINIISHGYFG